MAIPSRLHHRRSVLRGAVSAAFAVCPVCAFPAETPPHWAYEGVEGPEHWAELSPEVGLCGTGHAQTPVDLVGPAISKLDAPAIAYETMRPEVLNNGHTIQVLCPRGSNAVIDGERFELLQFHFHHPSEHLLAGRRFPMEVHFVHKAADGGLAVIGAFITPGEASPAVEALWAVMAETEGGKAATRTDIDPNALLPDQHHFFRYTGSLTTPPCTEGLLWTVMRDPITLIAAQIDRFAALFPNNARPIQPLRDRVITDAL